jgi:hypothetical protein
MSTGGVGPCNADSPAGIGRREAASQSPPGGQGCGGMMPPPGAWGRPPQPNALREAPGGLDGSEGRPGKEWR